MKYYVVFDTSVLVSALYAANPLSATVRVVDRMFARDIIPLYSETILKEYNDVLRREKFRFLPADVDDLIETIQKIGRCINPSATGEILPDMTDLPFYEVVMDTREADSYLVTGNLKHFPQKPFIVTARQMLDILDGKTE